MPLSLCSEGLERQSAVVYNTGDRIEGECVQFRLLYAGNELVSDGDATQKHKIRRAFHPQLKRLWMSDRKLCDLAMRHGLHVMDPNTPVEEVEESVAQLAYMNYVGDKWARGKFRFVPLVTQDICLKVSLDVLFLRPDQHPLIKQGGDLDNRLKTLFDALRIPEHSKGLGESPLEGEEPFFVLLQDDCLISEIRVETDNLLMLPNNVVHSAKDAFLIIDVKLKPTRGMARAGPLNRKAPTGIRAFR